MSHHPTIVYNHAAVDMIELHCPVPDVASHVGMKGLKMCVCGHPGRSPGRARTIRAESFSQRSGFDSNPGPFSACLFSFRYQI